ncbi:hypothetical protein SERLA73DRAFT_190135 [Serpula lacrymans var. lacrymans S7.3]|uniref:Uncharacterized protein n=2 Tax=Serpula lacrymans var. lacrymans TaxID=341189 RepID=F8QF51_SERL3|nr:uncharacterized protein SERLADRAFT_461980 [Serpula lacrymans var. lacrymans S7.9]EGN93010.1 hypothetical protein SERLA73DRAFT_190135 [Serpula lacrymans var. lacrymans S7.3]EGO27850.1 hypothetical protein SERLADRAFT_461980 [Serpula lacrymans var. lacrymans S7.9]
MAHAFPFMAQRILGPEASADAESSPQLCLPGCTCHRKLHSQSSDETTMAREFSNIPSLESRSSQAGSTRSTVPIRIPTSMERRQTIAVTLRRSSQP